MLDAKQEEKIIRGFSNASRIKILELLGRGKEFSLSGISKELRLNIKTASLHLQKLEAAGLVSKRKRSIEVFHVISRRGEKVLRFMKELN